MDANALLVWISPHWFPDVNSLAQLIPGAPTKVMTPGGVMNASAGAGIMNDMTVMAAGVKRVSFAENPRPPLFTCVDDFGSFLFFLWFLLFLFSSLFSSALFSAGV